MRPPPPPSTTTPAVLLFLITLLPFLTISVLPHTCPPLATAETLCPPFTFTPPYPFSFSAGCGHPSFQLYCPSGGGAAVISVNNLTFSLLGYDPNSSSLTLSPIPTPTRRRGCSPTAIFSNLTRSISFSGTPFRVSDSSCARLTALKPCPPLNLPNCSRCPLECKVITNPIIFISDCGASSTRHSDDFHTTCRDDVLGYLDNILIRGLEVEWDEDQDLYFPRCRSCQAKLGSCGFNLSEPQKPFLCFPAQARIRQKSPNRTAILTIASLFLFLLIALSIVFVVIQFRKKALPEAAGEDPTVVFLRRHRSASLLPPVFAYDDLDSSTNHFDPKLKIGDGGFGSVYLGHLPDGGLVAVKHLHKHKSSQNAFSTKSFCNEILILSSIDHPNLVRLHGYCSDPRGLLLVYDYIPNGTLADHLHGEKKKSPYRKGALSWATRVDIACQTAMAVEYLHFSVVPPVVHRDITSSNIFVDQDMRIRVGDFGLSRLLVGPEAMALARDPSEGVCTGPQGTPGYLDPDYFASFRLNEKSDIYSFGVVLLELITGMPAVGPAHGTSGGVVTLAELVVPKIQMGLLYEVVDPTLAVGGGEGVGAVAELAFRCLAADKDDRPDAREVVAELRRIRAAVGFKM